MLISNCDLKPVCSILLLALFFVGVLRADEIERFQVGPGIEYFHKTVRKVPWSIYVLKIDRRQPRLNLVTTLPEGKLLGLSKLTDQVTFIPEELGKPLGGINGDFFSWRKGPYQGDPAGLQILNGELVSGPYMGRTGIPGIPHGIASFWIDSKKQPHITPVTSKCEATFANGKKLPFRLNAERTNHNDAVLYTHIAGATTRTTNGAEFVLESAGLAEWLPLRAGQQYRARVRAIGATNSALDTNIVVLSLGPKLAKEFRKIKVGDVVKLSTDTTPDLRNVRTAVGGGPILVRDGAVQKFGTEPHRDPRSAVGFNSTHVFFVVVDGRRKDVSDGMTFPELAEEMKQWGCTQALNLDGGGSAMLWVKGEIKNQPSDNHERPNGNSLVLVRADSPAQHNVPQRGAELLIGELSGH